MTTWLGRMRLLLRLRALLLPVAASGLLASADARAQPYPTRAVTIIVTSAAGGLTDVLSRAVGQRLSQLWAQPVVIENRGGAGHSLAATAVKAAAADGYTLLSTETGMFTIQPFLHGQGKLPYAAADFAPVASYAAIPMALLVNPAVPAQSVGTLVTLARNKAMSYATAGLGTAPHMGALLLQGLSGAKLTAVHYRGAGPALNDVIAGHVDLITMGPSIALPMVRAGKLKMLGFGSQERVPQLADVPTIAESIPGYEAGVSFGLFAPAETPAAIIAKINADVQQIFAETEFRERFLEPQVLQTLPGSAAAFGSYLQAEATKWSRVIAQAKLKID